MQVWDRARAEELTGIVDAAMPSENLSADELVACLWDDRDATVVLATDDGEAAAAAVVREVRGRRVGFVQLVATKPNARRRGHARDLVTGLRDWALDEQAAVAMQAGGGAPYYLWPGVDATATPALCLFESLGFAPHRTEFNMTFTTRHRAPVPDGVSVTRVLDEADAAAGLSFVDTHWPNWVAETERAVDHGSCHIAKAASDGKVVGFGCHSVNRLGWLGPMGTDPVRRHGGLGNALLSAIAKDLMAAGLASVEVAWVGPLGFYAKAANATVSRVFTTWTLIRPG
jgi:GNAT superfamily N-acetyltransferase